MKKIKNWIVEIFIICVSVLSFVAVLGIWGVFTFDILLKLVQTLWIVALVAVAVIVAAPFIGKRASAADPPASALPDPMFTQIRRYTLDLLVVGVSLFALIGIISIWLIYDNIISKSLVSIVALAFCEFIVVVICRECEGNPRYGGSNTVVLALALLLVIGWIVSNLSIYTLLTIPY
ncbi:MAG: hypothetical protein ACREGH_00985 [Minisyncoccia bacterium]